MSGTRDASLAGRGLRFLVIALAYAGLNLAMKPLQAYPGVALIYLPSALGVAAGTLWPVEAGLAVLAGTLATPWNPGFLGLHLLFAAGNAVEAALPGLALRPCTRRQCVLQVVLWTCFVNTGANFILARTVPSMLSVPGWQAGGWLADLSWWLGDVVAVAAFALPALYRLRPALFLGESGALQPPPRVRPAAWASAVLTAGLISVALLVADHLRFLPFNWFAVLYLVPIGLMTARSGLGGALTTNAICAVAYLLTLGVESLAGRPSPLLDPRRMLVVHANLVVFAAFAIGAGYLRTRNLRLAAELDARWRALRETFEGLIRGLAAAIEARDPSTQQHVDRVATWAEELARRLGCSEDEVEAVRWGAILHDVGKIGVPDAILFKPGRLTPEEHRIMERHLDLGARIVERTNVLPQAVPLIRYHEERWDGAREGSFPARFGLRGDEIPRGARIIAIVDAFDAMTSDRPYRPARSAAEAIAELRAQAGRQFDPELVEAFIALLEEGGTGEGR